MRSLGYAILALVVAGLTAAVVAPAQWLAPAVRAATGGRVEIADAQGSVWRGSAVVVVGSGGESGTPVSLPDRLSWSISPLALVAGNLDVTASHPFALSQPLTIRAPLLTPGPAAVAAATLRLPASVLTGLGAPWNTVRPGGILQLSWDRLMVSNAGVEGTFSGEWQSASSALTPVSPMGHYRLNAEGSRPMRLELQTVSGPLELSGSGTIDDRGHLRFRGRAQAKPDVEPAIKSQLAGLISLLGRRDGDGAILSLG
jgi:general secretion pathway protein N